MRMRSALAIGISLILLAPCALAERKSTLEPSGPAPGGQRRFALVIGNSAYKSAPLRNPVNDARAIGRVLAETGFSVTLVEDATESGMRRAIRGFGDALAQTGGVGLFYYAGHAMQVRGKNFLIPVQADIQREDEVEDQAVDANLVLRKMDSAKNALNIVVLDSCRNNPFKRSFRSAAQGLAQMDAPSGTLIAFATAPGSVAADGDGENGLYTTHLLRAIKEPGLPVEQLFKQVRIGVTRDTDDRQVPWESSSLKGNFYFVAPDPTRLSADQRQRQEEAVARAVGEAEARAARERAELEGRVNALMAQLLAKQRTELEAERTKRGVSGPAPAASERTQVATRTEPAPRAEAVPQAKPEPERVASAAPSTTAIAASRTHGVSAGDRWTYRRWRKKPANRDALVSDVRSGRRPAMRVRIKAVQGGSILETRTYGNSDPQEWVHTAGRYILGLGRSGSASIFTFSPYLLTFQAVKVGESWPIPNYQKLGNCSQNPSYDCSFRAKVVARESVTVRAGTFDALRIEVEQTAYHKNGAAQRVATYWYAEAVKRHVKVTWRKVDGVWSGPDADFELHSYKVH